MATAATAQINARIDAQLKREGDAALANAGITPTQAVRAVWELARTCAVDSARLREALFPDEAKKRQRDERSEIERKLALVHEGVAMQQRFYESNGLPWPPAPDNRSFFEMKEDAYFEKYGDSAQWAQ